MTMFSNDVLIKQKNNFNFQNSRKSNTLFLFNNRYDEPTYLTFRIDFFPTTLPVNKIDSLPGYYENDIKLVSYDDMPQPLLDINNDYSTYKYLKEQIGDEYRADLLKAFISGLADLTWNTPYYIQEMEGINDLLTVDPKRGARVDQEQILTLKCIDNLDQRILSLMNLYKKVAWDDVFQRWILPDMMRYFKMRIYISEFRVFHNSPNNKSENSMNNFDIKKYQNASKYSTYNTLQNLADKIRNVTDVSNINIQDSWTLSDDILNEIMPTICLECSMCEFDISDIYSHLNALSAADPKSYSGQPEIKIKIGNVNEILNYNILNLSNDSKRSRNYKNIISDKKLKNGRFLDNGFRYTEDELEFIDVSDMQFEGDFNVDNISRYDRTGVLNNNDSNPTTRYNEQIEGKFNSFIGQTLKNSVNTVISYLDEKVDNTLNRTLNKRLVNGLSINDMLSTTTHPNIVNMYNTFAKKSKAIQELYPEVSQATKDGLEITIFKDMLEKHTLSTATTDSEEKMKEISKSLLEYGKANNLKTTDDYINTLIDALKIANG